MIGKTIAAGLVAIGLAGIFAPATAQAERVSHFKIGNWDGGAYTHSKTGAFSHCAASASYRSGTTLIFSIYTDLNWAFGLVNNTWKLTPGQTYPVRYWVDRGRDFVGKAEVVSEHQVKVPLPASDRLFAQVRRGRLLSVRAANDTMTFSLTSTNRMLSRLFECARYWRNRAPAAQSNPFSNDGGSSNPFSGDEKKEDSGNPFAAPEETSLQPGGDAPRITQIGARSD
ncbi:hypothetical protein C8N35_1011520 [Breoghania corrubedonensis]|uniref:Uncharacterized protein n=1 Tax=Breoghania corrubedonensis TaxID=665038 RepID=A0A2T5VIC2_9HYPH|nr:hypothetical protein [Breoghania corrubedonensis]PTW63466.1 hypothetical protein C8N35_1011520 [Breoghania corrubedonensis]